MLKQDRSAPVPVEKQVAILYAAVHEILAKIPVDQVQAFEEMMFLRLDQDPDGLSVMNHIREKGDLPEETEGKLKGFLEKCRDEYLAGKR